MKKFILCVAGVFMAASCFAGSEDMAKDILVQIIHGPVNSNPNLDEITADKTVVLSLRAAIVTLTCAQNYRGESAAIDKCLSSKQPSDKTLGSQNSLSVDVGKTAAFSAMNGHQELKTDNYAQVVNFLEVYKSNLIRRGMTNASDSLAGQLQN